MNIAECSIVLRGGRCDRGMGNCRINANRRLKPELQRHGL